MQTTLTSPRPFLKWAGGKSQLVGEMFNCLPHDVHEGKIKKYFEPFLGGGAFFFFLSDKGLFQKSYLYEVNKELFTCYSVLQESFDELEDELKPLGKKYSALNEVEQQEFFYEKRVEFNQLVVGGYKGKEARLAALIIFLNRTCYNGLYRVNSKNEFNVPSGRYKNPNIFNEENLNAVHHALKDANLILGDFSKCLSEAGSDSFVYFDPPYRPLNSTSSFTSYSKDSFNDEDQKRLRGVYGKLDKLGAKVMLSNSDPWNTNPKDNFFDDLYEGFNIKRVNAVRLINSKAEKRGVVSELLIMNYGYQNGNV